MQFDSCPRQRMFDRIQRTGARVAHAALDIIERRQRYPGGAGKLRLVVGHNDDPPVPGAGSAIFLHLERPDGGPTEGCVALQRDDLLAVLVAVGPESVIDIDTL